MNATSEEAVLAFTGGMDFMYNIRGLAVDRAGYVYIARDDSDYEIFWIDKYDPEAAGGVGAVIDSYFDFIGEQSSFVWDIVFKYPYLYAANNGGSPGYKILKLDTDLNLIYHFGDVQGGVGNFYGPSRFVGHPNPGFLEACRE